MRSLLARVGLNAGAGLTKAATVPACAVCGAYPVLVGPLTAAGLFGTAAILHNLLVVLAPLNLVILGVTFRQHRRPWGLVVASVGVLFILMHLAFHVIPWRHPIIRALYPHEFQVGMAFIWIGIVLLSMGVFLDWRAQRQPRLLLIR